MTAVVSLPMYDWPAVSEAVDRLWNSIRRTLEELDVDAPIERARPEESIVHWRDPKLLLSQTCGLPLIRHLADDVAIVGAFDHHLPGTGPGDYHSVLVVGPSTSAATLADLDGATAAVNSADSQSGHAALRHALVPHPDAVAAGIESGSHRRSIELVADGEADVAAIDAVSWELALAHEPAAQRCRVVGRTDPAPALPIVTNRANAALLPHLRAALAHGVANLEPADRDALHVHGFVARDLGDYHLLAERLATADDAGVPILV